MGMGNRQPLFQGRYNNEPSGLAPTSQANQLEAPSRVSPTQFDPSQLRMGGGKGGYNPSRPVQPQPQPQPQTPPRFDPSQFRMGGGKGGYLPSGPYRPPEGPMPTIPPETMPPDPIEDTRADPPVLDDPAPPTPEPYVPYVRPRPTRGLFSDQSGIASLRGQYRAPSMSNPQFQPYRPVQRYQPPQRMPRPPQRMPSPYMPSPRMPSPYGQPPRGGPSKGGRQSPPFMPSPYGNPRMPSPRMPSPYGQPPRGGPSKGGRGPSGPTKGGRQDPQYATLTGRSQPTIPFNPPYGG